MLDTDQLRSFLAIVDTGSFTRAAERVNKTQSAVSMHVRRLEEQLGRDLFVKHGRGVRLSEEGERLIDFARRMLQVEAAALQALSQQGLTGRVRLGIPDDYADPFLAEIITRITRQHPLVELAIVCEGSQALAERVRLRDLDLAIVTDCSSISGVEVVREEPLVWVAGPGTRIDRTQPVTLALGGPTCLWRQLVERTLEQHRIPTRLLLASNNFAAIAPLLRAGLAVTILPIGSVRSDLRILGEADGLPALPNSRMGILHAAGAPTPEARALADAIRATLTIRPAQENRTAAAAA